MNITEGARRMRRAGRTILTKSGVGDIKLKCHPERSGFGAPQTLAFVG